MSRFVGKKSRRLIDYSAGPSSPQITNVVRVYFTPMDQSGAIYAIDLVRSSVTQEIRAQRRQERARAVGGAS